MMRKIIKVILPILVLAGGIAVLKGLIATKPTAKKTSPDDLGALVEVLPAKKQTQLAKVVGHGIVMASRLVVLSPEVTGRVTWVNKELVPGGRLVKGTRMLKLNASDYYLAIRQQKAQVRQARTALALEGSRKSVAAKEWEVMGGKRPAQGSLASRDPQWKSAEATLVAAQSGLQRAQLNIGRTLLKAPFNALVQTRNVDVGQIVGPASRLVNLVGTDTFWVQVSLPVSKLAWFDVPGIGGAKKGAMATIRQRAGREVIERQGRVVRLMGDLDQRGRMARVLVEIKDPLGLAANSRKSAVGETRPSRPKLPLLLGSFVEVEIEGRTINGAISVSREALHNGDEVWVMSPDRRLDIKKVDVVWRRRDSVIVSSGLDDGALVITSPVPAPVQGMKIRTADDSPPAGQARVGGDAAVAPKTAPTGAKTVVQ